eukprot:g15189.t1
MTGGQLHRAPVGKHWADYSDSEESKSCLGRYFSGNDDLSYKGAPSSEVEDSRKGLNARIKQTINVASQSVGSQFSSSASNFSPERPKPGSAQCMSEVQVSEAGGSTGSKGRGGAGGKNKRRGKRGSKAASTSNIVIDQSSGPVTSIAFVQPAPAAVPAVVLPGIGVMPVVPAGMDLNMGVAPPAADIQAPLLKQEDFPPLLAPGGSCTNAGPAASTTWSKKSNASIGRADEVLPSIVEEPLDGSTHDQVFLPPEARSWLKEAGGSAENHSGVTIRLGGQVFWCPPGFDLSKLDQGPIFIPSEQGVASAMLQHSFAPAGTDEDMLQGPPLAPGEGELGFLDDSRKTSEAKSAAGGGHSAGEIDSWADQIMGSSSSSLSTPSGPAGSASTGPQQNCVSGSEHSAALAGMRMPTSEVDPSSMNNFNKDAGGQGHQDAKTSGIVFNQSTDLIPLPSASVNGAGGVTVGGSSSSSMPPPSCGPAGFFNAANNPTPQQITPVVFNHALLQQNLHVMTKGTSGPLIPAGPGGQNGNPKEAGAERDMMDHQMQIAQAQAQAAQRQQAELLLGKMTDGNGTIGVALGQYRGPIEPFVSVLGKRARGATYSTTMSEVESLLTEKAPRKKTRITGKNCRNPRREVITKRDADDDGRDSVIGRTTTTVSEVEAEHLTTNMLPPAAHPHPHPSSSSTTAKNGVSTSSVPLTADGASTADHHERLMQDDVDDDDELDLLGISGNAFVSAACAAAQVDKRLLEIQKFKTTALYARALSLGLNEELERRSTSSSRGNKTSKAGEDVEGEEVEGAGVEYRPETPIVRKEDSRKFWKNAYESWRRAINTFVHKRDPEYPTTAPS